jgi:hypothetical protein
VAVALIFIGVLLLVALARLVLFSERGGLMLRTIVVPLNGSGLANRALPVANSIAQFGDIHAAARCVTSGSAPKVDICDPLRANDRAEI